MGQFEKLYGSDSFDTKYSPGDCIGTQAAVMQGNPDPLNISTSFIDRQNLTMRMSIRRFTRLANGFSKKIDNHYAAIAALQLLPRPQDAARHARN